MRYGSVGWRTVMLNGRQLAAARDERASKNSPAKRSGWFCEERKRSLQKKRVPLCSLSQEEYGRASKSEIIVMTRVKTTLFSCRHSSLRLATP